MVFCSPARDSVNGARRVGARAAELDREQALGQVGLAVADALELVEAETAVAASILVRMPVVCLLVKRLAELVRDLLRVQLRVVCDGRAEHLCKLVLGEQARAVRVVE